MKATNIPTSIRQNILALGTFLMLVLAANFLNAQSQAHYNVTNGPNNGLRFYNGSDLYRISFGNSSLFKYGPVQDWSIKMTMNNNANRGWTWGSVSYAPIAALNTLGDMQIAGKFTAIGSVAIGSTTMASGYKLSVDGKVICEELKVDLSQDWPDYVFAADYKLMSLNAVENYIAANKHLPGMQAAAELETNGMELGDMATRQQEKIEELYLHMIELNKQVQAIQQENTALKAQLSTLQK